MYEYEAIEEGLQNGEFFLEYLPTVELGTGRCVGAEALCRWRRPSGVVQPADFLPFIENTPLSGILTYWVLEQIAEDFRDWLKLNDAFISFNVSPEVLGRGGLYYVAQKTGLFEIRHKLVMEIVERGVPDRLGVEALNRSAERGVRLALDDVGADAANAIVLSRCNVEMIKLDRQLISEVRPGEPLPDGIMAMDPFLRTNRFTVVAEGVESVQQVEVLKSMSIRLAQGFYFSRPISANAFKAFFTEEYSS